LQAPTAAISHGSAMQNPKTPLKHQTNMERTTWGWEKEEKKEKSKANH